MSAVQGIRTAGAAGPRCCRGGAQAHTHAYARRRRHHAASSWCAPLHEGGAARGLRCASIARPAPDITAFDDDGDDDDVKYLKDEGQRVVVSNSAFQSDLAELIRVGETFTERQSIDEGPKLEDIMRPVEAEMDQQTQALRNVVGERHPLLLKTADHIFNAGGKRVRPLIALLVAKATRRLYGFDGIVDEQIRLAMISEMIHTASLVHDDVLDDCELRRGKGTVHSLYGTRVAVLAGDFLFAQSSWFLANLNNLEVIKLISQVIADFADGEIAQAASLFNTEITVESYLDKSFYKTASLIAASCRSAAVFSDCSESEKDAIFQYGCNLGLAFQIVDDVLDFTQTEEDLGKPPGQDLASGNITAPTIFAMQRSDRLRHLLAEDRLGGVGMAEEAMALVVEHGGIEAAKQLARQHGEKAKRNLEILPLCAERDSLEMMVEYVLQRIS